MKKAKKITLYFLILCFTLSLCACGNNSNGEGDSTVGTSDLVDVSALVNDTIEMPYDPNSTYNPLTTDSMHNKAICDLMFEGLFTLDAELNSVPVLCTDYATEDGINFVFNLRTDVYFHNGEKMTSADAVYSINAARGLSLYTYRFSTVNALYAINESSFGVTLSEPNYSFPALLTLKIIKSGTMGWLAPYGTGPYYMDSTGASPVLRPFAQYRDLSAHFTESIGLVDATNVDIRNGFAEGIVDIVNMDPLGYSSFLLGSDMDKYYYNTTALSYIGFNYRSFQAGNPTIRKAVSLLINREYIAKNYYNGCLQPTSIILNPSGCAYCDPSWEAGRTFNRANALTLLDNAGIVDADGDGWREIPDGESGYGSTTMKFIVNDDNSEKVDAASYITDILKEAGLKVTLSVLSWKDYTEALKSGSFDMYFAEALVAPDYDFYPILSVEGAMNYGHVSETAFGDLCKALLASPDQESRIAAAKALCDSVANYCPIAPIGYSKNILITHRKQLAGISPNAYELFHRKTNAE